MYIFVTVKLAQLTSSHARSGCSQQRCAAPILHSILSNSEFTQYFAPALPDELRGVLSTNCPRRHCNIPEMRRSHLLTSPLGSLSSINLADISGNARSVSFCFTVLVFQLLRWGCFPRAAATNLGTSVRITELDVHANTCLDRAWVKIVFYLTLTCLHSPRAIGPLVDYSSFGLILRNIAIVDVYFGSPKWTQVTFVHPMSKSSSSERNECYTRVIREIGKRWVGMMQRATHMSDCCNIIRAFNANKNSHPIVRCDAQRFRDGLPSGTCSFCDPSLSTSTFI